MTSNALSFWIIVGFLVLFLLGGLATILDAMWRTDYKPPAVPKPHLPQPCQRCRLAKVKCDHDDAIEEMYG